MLDSQLSLINVSCSIRPLHIALEWCWIAAGRGHVYLHGKQQIWDYAAAGLILHEAGGHSMTLDGEPVLSVNLEARSVVAALNKTLFDEWTTWLGIKQASSDTTHNPVN